MILAGPVCIWMERKRIISNFFEFGGFLSEKGRNFEFFVNTFEFYISKYNACIQSLILINIPIFSIIMKISSANLDNFWMTDHNIMCHMWWNIPFIFITNIWFIFSRFLHHLKGKRSCLFSGL